MCYIEGGQTYAWESTNLKSDVLLANNSAIVVGFSNQCFYLMNVEYRNLFE